MFHPSINYSLKGKMFALRDEENQLNFLFKVIFSFYNLMIFLMKVILVAILFLLAILVYLIVVIFGAYFTPSIIISELNAD